MLLTNRSQSTAPTQWQPPTFSDGKRVHARGTLIRGKKRHGKAKASEDCRWTASVLSALTVLRNKGPPFDNSPHLLHSPRPFDEFRRHAINLYGHIGRQTKKRTEELVTKCEEANCDAHRREGRRFAGNPTLCQHRHSLRRLAVAQDGNSAAIQRRANSAQSVVWTPLQEAKRSSTPVHQYQNEVSGIGVFTSGRRAGAAAHLHRHPPSDERDVPRRKAGGEDAGSPPCPQQCRIARGRDGTGQTRVKRDQGTSRNKILD